MIETYGLVAAIEGADSMLKAANVELVGKYKVGAGIITIIVKGDVGAVNASVNAGKASAERLGKVISTHVIPRPAGEIYSIFEKEQKNIEVVEIPVEDPIEVVEDPVEAPDVQDTHDANEFKGLNDEELFEKLSSLKFADLRKMAKDIMEIAPLEELTEKGSKLHSKKDVLEFLMNFKELI